MPGIYFARCRSLRAMFSLVRAHLAVEPATRSVMFGCGECWNDEAIDAVQDHILASSDLVPVGPTADRPIAYELQRELLQWQANSEAVWAFSAMCTEEGWEEDTGVVNGELKTIYLERTSPLLIVQRDGDRLRGSWLGKALRGWLDVPAALQDREYGGIPGLMPDPPPATLTAAERELHELVLADPYDRGPRDVLRDLWIERGDPRGEYCTVSEPGKVDHVRAAALIAEHARSWVGPLQPVIPLSGALFGYGPWLRAAIVHADRAALDAVADAPEWGSLERIEFAPGSARLVSPRMANVRELGPLAIDELAPLHAWQLHTLDVELDRDPAALATLRLPLATLRLRPTRALGTAWVGGLAALHEAPWWPGLARLEIWLPGGFPDPVADVMAALEPAARLVGDKTLAIGVLDAGQPTGWIAVARGGQRTAELERPDLRTELGRELAARMPLVAPGLIETTEDWLTFALGVPALQPL